MSNSINWMGNRVMEPSGCRQAPQTAVSPIQTQKSKFVSPSNQMQQGHLCAGASADTAKQVCFAVYSNAARHLCAGANADTARRLCICSNTARLRVRTNTTRRFCICSYAARRLCFIRYAAGSTSFDRERLRTILSSK